jgi:hypothetical protein
MFLRSVVVASSLLAITGYTNAASSNSCSNVDTFSSYDQKGLQENDYGIYAVGTFRIEGEEDESKQPMFNLAMINCEKPSDGTGPGLECKVTKAVVWANTGKPNTDNPNCSLDLDFSDYSMKELQRGVLSGIETTTSCFNSTLTIDRNTKRVYLLFTRSASADNFDRIRPGTCGALPRTEVLMNCTSWPRIRKQGKVPPRYCDFSSSSGK